MKKILGIVYVLAACSIMGCGKEKTSEQKIDDVVAIYSESASDIIMESSTEMEVKPSGWNSYQFIQNGVEIYVNQDMGEVLAVLGEPVSYFEAESCAFEGLDKMYTYSSFEIDTYPDKGKDYISAIYLKDDTVATQEGISLFMTQEDMERVYGVDYEVKDGAFLYYKGDGYLSFIVENREIISIEYRLSVVPE